jgi:Flp pilus assembly protein CpaB
VNKRLIIKTILVCTGIFIILASIAVFLFNSAYKPDTEKRISVIVASKDILPGETIKEDMIKYRIIRESTLSPHMLKSPEQAINARSLAEVKAGDYFISYNLLSPDIWQSNDARIIAVPMDIDERLGNLIQKGSVIDIKVLPADEKTIPKLVLSKIVVTDMLDENGLSSGEVMGSRKGYVVIVLDKEQRNRLYAAMQYGKLMYELYCDLTQPKDIENFIIPQEFFKNEVLERYMVPEQQTGRVKDGGAN